MITVSPMPCDLEVTMIVLVAHIHILYERARQMTW